MATKTLAALIAAEFVRNPYNYDRDALSNATGLKCEDESRTQQQFLEESDINYIADRFMKTGEIKQVTIQPTYGDFEGIYDYQSAMNQVKEAKDAFMALPPKIRSRFDNDPQKLLEFLADENNREEAEALKLIDKKEPTNGPTSTGIPENASKEAAGSSGAAASKSKTDAAQGPGQKADR